MIRILGTVFAALFGLAFGSFLNVCLSRWPEGESIVHPRSHCRKCDHTLTWWENVPLVSWLALRGRCRNCRASIGCRYPLVELSVAALWAHCAWTNLILIQNMFYLGFFIPQYAEINALHFLGNLLFLWLLVALLFLDAEHLWLPNKLTIPGILIGFVCRFGDFLLHHISLATLLLQALGIVAAAALILLIRWLYQLIRHREGIGLGDAKLMALLAAWLGLPGALLAFFLGVVLGALIALVMLAIPSARSSPDGWALKKLPLGTFLCIGGIISALWGQPIIAAYLRWSGL